MKEDIEYKDQEGNPTTLDALCRTKPEWAANRIRAEIACVAELKRIADSKPARIAELEAEKAELIEANDWSDTHGLGKCVDIPLTFTEDDGVTQRTIGFEEVWNEETGTQHGISLAADDQWMELKTERDTLRAQLRQAESDGRILFKMYEASEMEALRLRELQNPSPPPEPAADKDVFVDCGCYWHKGYIAACLYHEKQLNKVRPVKTVEPAAYEGGECVEGQGE